VGATGNQIGLGCRLFATDTMALFANDTGCRLSYPMSLYFEPPRWCAFLISISSLIPLNYTTQEKPYFISVALQLLGATVPEKIITRFARQRLGCCSVTNNFAYMANGLPNPTPSNPQGLSAFYCRCAYRPVIDPRIRLTPHTRAGRMEGAREPSGSAAKHGGNR